jgi:hypothetical protein
MFILFGLGHIENRCWKKSAKGPATTTNFLKVLVNDEETTLSKLNHIYGKEKMCFLGSECQRNDYMCLLVQQKFRRRG